MVGAKRRSNVTVDLKKNRLFISVAGSVRKADVEAIYTDIRFCVGDLQPGFDVITDLRESRFGYLAGVTILYKIIEFLQYHEVGKIIRVVNASGILQWQLKNITKMIASYEPIYVANLEEAEKILADNNS